MGRDKGKKNTTSNTTTTSTPYWAYMCAQGQTKPDTTFVSACEDYLKRFEHILGEGKPRGGAETVKGCSVYHNTQPSANKTVFFDWQGECMRVFGVGEHSGGSGAKNAKYSGTWFTGKKLEYNRGK